MPHVKQFEKHCSTTTKTLAQRTVGPINYTALNLVQIVRPIPISQRHKMRSRTTTNNTWQKFNTWQKNNFRQHFAHWSP